MIALDGYVKAGVELLDRRRPGWRDEIDLENLDMAEFDQCILGQLYGHYDNGVDQLGINFRGEDYGFWAYGRYGELTALWRDAVRLVAQS